MHEPARKLFAGKRYAVRPVHIMLRLRSTDIRGFSWTYKVWCFNRA